MKIKRLLFLAISILSLIGANALAQDYPKAIFPGDYPDPSILCDGRDYYMTSTPNCYSPGLLIWHSTDLMSWKPVCRVSADVVGDAWAPDLVKYKNKYYIYFATPGMGTNQVIWADHIRGPWSKPIDLKIGNIDPGHVVDDAGKRYLLLSHGCIVPLSDDGLSAAGEMKKIYDGWDWPNGWVLETKDHCIEGPKIIKRGDYFYLTAAQGGTAGPATSHMLVSARSRNLFGPYENSPYNPIVHTYSASEQWWSKGHGPLIEDKNGNWWVVYHAYENGFRTLGRQTLIEPVEWTEDGWFRTAKGANPIRTKGRKVNCGMKLSDDFHGKTLGLQWAAWRTYDPKSITLKNNSLYLGGKGSTPKDARLLLVTATDKSYELQAEITLEKGSVGGLLLFYNENAFAGIYSDGNQFTICENAEKQLTIPNKIGSHFFIRIINNRNMCDMLVSKDKRNWETVYTRLDVSAMHHNNYGGFLALRPCLMAAGNADVKFNDFVYKPLN